MVERARDLAESAGWNLPALDRALESVADPDQAVINLERWLVATGNARLNAEEVASHPDGWARLMRLLGASQPLSETLVQNPELVHLILSPTSEDWEAEGRRLLANAPSYSYQMDRLRYLKQRGLISIVSTDLEPRSDPESTWHALSLLADTLIKLAFETAWKHHATSRGLDFPCPVGVIAFGKHGGNEVNYNSDLDLTYVLLDGAPEGTEREALKFAEAFGRALTDRMGRGILYRVDLRLRPYGSTGALVPTMRATESYYANHAEAWEAMALIRSRFIVGPADLAERWEIMRNRFAFPRRTAEATVDELKKLRIRIQVAAPDDDIKRGFGGIRDPEFATQLLQSIHGFSRETVRERETIPALNQLAQAGIPVAEELAAGYRELRRLEHYLQLRNDSQTHRLPSDPREQVAVARLMGWKDDALSDESSRLRTETRRAYLATVGENIIASAKTPALSPPEMEIIDDWFGRLPGGKQFESQLNENRDSASRVSQIARMAPRLVALLGDQVAVSELIVSGEIEEDYEFGPVRNAEQHRRSVATAMAKCVLGPVDQRGQLATTLTGLADALIRSVAKEVELRASIYGLGSLGNGLMAPGSDADLLFLASAEDREPAERAASSFLRWFTENLSLSVDLRLRPDGGKGLLVRTPAALRYYSETDMDVWERFALGHARPLSDPNEIELLYEIAYAGLSLTEVQSLAEMKLRIENERVEAIHGSRNVKLGPGGLLDIEWLVHLCEMRYTTAMDVLPGKPFEDRIRSLNTAELLNAVETDTLVRAHRWLLNLRVGIWLQGIDNDVLPENPGRLNRIAEFMSEPDGNSLLAAHADVSQSVRRLYEMGWEILAR